VVSPKRYDTVTISFYVISLFLVVVRFIEFMVKGIKNSVFNTPNSYQMGYVAMILASFAVINLGLS
jgi:hypothetical protein